MWWLVVGLLLFDVGESKFLVAFYRNSCRKWLGFFQGDWHDGGKETHAATDFPRSWEPVKCSIRGMALTSSLRWRYCLKEKVFLVLGGKCFGKSTPVNPQGLLYWWYSDWIRKLSRSRVYFLAFHAVLPTSQRDRSLLTYVHFVRAMSRLVH